MTIPAFSSLGLSDSLVEAIANAGYAEPTPIQEQGIPAFLAGSDIIVQAQTGTGKTAAFVLPFVQNADPADGPIQALVLTPTRELALQVSREFSRFGAATGLKSTAIYGGTAFQPQFDALETAHVVVATPGRLLDLFRRKRFDARNIRYFGLDEADELLSMGFEKDVLDIIAKLPKSRQSFICSATMGPAITRVAQNFISEPTTINVSSDEIGAQSVRHEYFNVRQHEKQEALRRLVGTAARGGAIVFANTRVATFTVTDALRRESVRVDVLNGELSQSEREKALARMRAGEIDFLVATDVAARGIDISGLPAVINYDMPESPEVYVHRTGRTGRAGQAGVAYSLVTPADISVFHSLQKFYKLEFHEQSLPTSSELRGQIADQVLDTVLEGLDANRSLQYAQHMPLARRLAGRDDGVRSIAKLIAQWLDSRDDAPARPAKKAKTAEPVLEEAASEVEAPEPRKSRRKRREEKPAAAAELTAEEPSFEEEKPRKRSGNADAGLVERVFEMLKDAPQRRGRWRAVRGLAREIEADEATVIDALEADERFEESRKRPGQWRLLIPKSDESREAQADADKPKRKAKNEEKSERKPEKRADEPEKAEKAAEQSKRATVMLTVNVGNEHGIEEEELRNEIVLCAGLDFDDVPSIRIDDDSSKVDVAAEYWEDVVAAVSGQTLAGQVLEFKRPRRRKKK